MCEFTVKLKTGANSEKVGEDIIFFQYNESGQARLADILGRSKITSPNSFVHEINMLENRHDITIIESEIVPYFVRFINTLHSNQEKDKNKRAEELIEAIKKQIY